MCQYANLPIVELSTVASLQTSDKRTKTKESQEPPAETQN